MQCIKKILIIFGLVGASQFVHGDDHSPVPQPIEFWGCEFNDGKTMDDLLPVIKEWKKVMGFSDNEINSKTKSLKGVLDPFSTKGNFDLLKRAGFKDISVIGKFICFEIILAIK